MTGSAFETRLTTACGGAGGVVNFAPHKNPVNNPYVTIFVKGRVRGRWSWGVTLHHPFKAGLLSPRVLHPSHHGAELQPRQVPAGGEP